MVFLVAEYSMYPIFMFFTWFFIYFFYILFFKVLHILLQIYKHIQAQMGNSPVDNHLEPCFCNEKVEILRTYLIFIIAEKVLIYFVELFNLINNTSG